MKPMSSFLKRLLWGALLAMPLGTAVAAWPERPIRLIVPYAAGQGADTLARLLSQALSKTLAQPIVVENRGGAGGNIGTGLAARAPADGYTFLLGTNATNAANGFLYANPGYDAGKDFAGVAMLGLLPMVICSTSSDLPANGVAQLIDRARARPDTINVGLPSTTARVVYAEFVKEAKAPLFGVIYKSSGQSMNDVLGGQIPLIIDTVTATRAHILGGKLHALGITSRQASALLPGVSPVSVQGVPGFEVVAWDALFAPRGTPEPVIAQMSQLVQTVLQQPEFRQKLLDNGVEPLVMGPSQLDAFVQAERGKWGSIIKEADIRAD